MAAPTRKKARAKHPGPAGSDPAEPAVLTESAEQRLAGEVRLAGGPARAAARLRAAGVTVDTRAGLQEKEKVSITLDRSLVEEIRAHFGQRALSASINELLYVALAQERLGQLVEEMEQEAGPASPEAYERVLAQWFASD
jgi:hypothetical protein